MENVAEYDGFPPQTPSSGSVCTWVAWSVCWVLGRGEASRITQGMDALSLHLFPAAAEMPCWKKTYFWFCGMSANSTPTLTREERAAQEQKLTSIVEKPLWKTVCNVNALLLLVINVFLWGYFG